MAQIAQFWSGVHPVVQWGCGVLLASFLYMIYALLQQTAKTRGYIDELALALGQNKTDNPDEFRQGFPLEILEELRSRLRELGTAPAEWWRRIEGNLESYTAPSDPEGWFLTEQPRVVLPYEVVVGREFNTAFFSSFPGILTGAGLTLTFIAILFALYGVHYNKGNDSEPVTGIEALINGLSGKFLSSIVALILSIVFTLMEKRSIRSLRVHYERLIATISDKVPCLSAPRILLDIQKSASNSAVSVSHISAEVVDRLVGAFNSSVVPALAEGMSSGVADKMQSEFRPTMDRMNETLESLKASILSLESQKQDSVTGELRGLMQSLETSLVQALSKMGEDFHHALTGAANREFGNVQGTLEGTRQMLSEMNVQFGSMQAAFSTIIEKAEQSTSDQMNAGREQTEALTALMNGLMRNLQESADQNINGVRTQLTLVVGDLTEKVGALSKDMMAAADTVSRQSQSTASQILEQTGTWSEATANRLEKLLSNIETRSEEFREAGRTLLQAHSFLKDTISQNASALDRMADASRQVQTYSTALAGQGEMLKSLTQLQTNVSAQLRESAGGLNAASAESGRILAIYRQNFEEYQAVIDDLDKNLGKILATLHTGLREYNQSMENNFTKIVGLSNDIVPSISTLLQNQVEELGGQLEELGTVISRATEQVNGRVK